MKQKLGTVQLLRCPPGTSFQDEGRYSGTSLGIPSAGAMDKKSYRWANCLLQNSAHSVALELSQPGLQLSFDQATFLSLAGAEARVFLNEQLVITPTQVSISPGDRLKIGAFSKGHLLYLCIAGGFRTDKYLGSGSDFDSITEAATKHTGQLLHYHPLSKVPDLKAKAKWSTSWFESPSLPVYPGPDWSLLTPSQQEELLSRSFHISKNSSRMGIQLEELLGNELPDLPTNPVFPGTVQLTPGGKLIVLMRDAGVTGGYPRILQLPEETQDRLAQKKTGEPIHFQLIP